MHGNANCKHRRKSALFVRKHVLDKSYGRVYCSVDDEPRRANPGIFRIDQRDNDTGIVRVWNVSNIGNDVRYKNVANTAVASRARWRFKRVWGATRVVECWKREWARIRQVYRRWMCRRHIHGSWPCVAQAVQRSKSSWRTSRAQRARFHSVVRRIVDICRFAIRINRVSKSNVSKKQERRNCQCSI